MTRKDPLEFLGAAYSFEPDEDAWLQGMCDAALPYQLGGGVAAYVSEFAPTNRVRAFASSEMQLPRAAAEQMASLVDNAYYRRIHAPFAASDSQEVWPRAAKDLGLSFEDIARSMHGRMPPAAWAFCGGDASHETALVVFHCKPGDAFATRDVHIMDCFAAHLNSALRLRSMLKKAPVADDDAVDAVLDPNGKMLHARKSATQNRPSLIDAVRKLERAKLRNATPEERVDLWRALVEGKWSILEQVDRDGKRMLLACANEPRTVRIRALSRPERAVAEYVSLGHRHKHIAYELGIAVSTVGAHLQSVLRKLGLRSRADLVKLFAAR
jgi:DNA-binding CsgD family transcriptional regulator